LTHTHFPRFEVPKKTVHPPPTWRLVRTAPQGQGDGAGSQGIAIQQGLRSVKTPGFSQKKKNGNHPVNMGNPWEKYGKIWKNWDY
jgi:hypothetical protein